MIAALVLLGICVLATFAIAPIIGHRLGGQSERAFTLDEISETVSHDIVVIPPSLRPPAGEVSP